MPILDLSKSFSAQSIEFSTPLARKSHSVVQIIIIFEITHGSNVVVIIHGIVNI